MGQKFGLDSSGVHRVLGQTKGQNPKPTRRRVEGIKNWAFWNTVEDRNQPPKVVVVMVGLLCRGADSPAALFEGLWGPH